jgi:hypothetical protein
MLELKKSALVSAILAALCVSPDVFAQQADTATVQNIGSGALRGRVLNTATGDYLRNAEVRIEGSRNVAYTQEGGHFQLTGIPAGDITVLVKYTGLQESRSTVSIEAGKTGTLDIALKAPSFVAGGGEATDLDMIKVTASRDGQASAIMERRAAMNAKNVVAADNYGALTMGDVG